MWDTQYHEPSIWGMVSPKIYGDFGDGLWNEVCHMGFLLLFTPSLSSQHVTVRLALAEEAIGGMNWR